MGKQGTGKITRKFVIKLILWFLLFDIILGGIIFVTSLSGFEGQSDDIETIRMFNSLLIKLVLINIASVIVSTLLATRSIKKKCEITDENKKSIFRNISIVLVIMFVLTTMSHNFIVNNVMDGDEHNIETMKQDLKEVNYYMEEYDETLPSYYEEGLQQVENFLTLINVYSYDFIVFVIMIPIEYLLIVNNKKENEEIVM